ncbi:MAG: alpha-N-arabinofuranosidase [Oscillospiraceae bacterium]|nr:alpha-N-arabinofuranosidase [Oscillospiraceae bacterium]
MNHVCLNFTESKGIINKNIYGHFSEHIGGVFYDGLWVGENSPVPNIRGFRKSLVESFKKINPPVLRWPGGCFAETYDWRDGIGPRERRPVRVNWWYNDDKRTESNQVGTHEFVDFCRLAGAKPYFAANITSSSPLAIRDWIEYCNFPENLTSLSAQRGVNGDPAPFGVEYWGIGNENWGGGGNMTPQMYAREFMRYKTICDSVNNAGCKFIACGPNGGDLNWTKGFLEEYQYNKDHPGSLYGFSLHYYCGAAGHPLKFSEDEYYQMLSQASRMENLIKSHRAVMDYYDPKRKLGLAVDEWGCWHQGGTGPSAGYNLFEQQSTVRDALVAGLTLNIFNNCCDVVIMANVAQLCNNLHSLFLAGGDNFVETPNYFVFDMYKTHQNGRQIPTLDDFGTIKVKDREPLKTVSVSASQDENGQITATFVNLDYANEKEVKLSAFGGDISGPATLTALFAGDARAYNSFENPEAVRPVSQDIILTPDTPILLPKSGVVSLVVKKA